MSSGVTAVYVDLSPLLDFCLSYAEGQEDTEYVLEEMITKKVVSEITWEQFSRQTSNRAELFSELFATIAKIRERVQADEEDLISYICKDVITEEWFAKHSLYGLNESVDVDIERLRDHIRDIGISDFLEELNQFEQRLPSKEQRIDMLIEDKSISERRHLMLETYINNLIGNSFRSENLVQAVFWNRNEKRGLVLVRKDDSAVVKKDEVNSVISKTLSRQDTLDIRSPRDILEAKDINPYQ